MTDSENRDTKPHRLFHAMVLMGGSLALGCGGISDESPQGTTGSGGSGGSGAGGTGGPGTTGTTGGGGSTTGSVTIGVTGIQVGTTRPMPIEPGPFECTPAKWECDVEVMYCDGGGFNLPEGCECNEARPSSPADCQEGEKFVCLEAWANAEGIQFTEEVPFSCQCLTEMDHCSDYCDEVAFPGSNCSQNAEQDSVLCGCAVIVLR
jgi:hypothetical protein